MDAEIQASLFHFSVDDILVIVEPFFKVRKRVKRENLLLQISSADSATKQRIIREAGARVGTKHKGRGAAKRKATTAEDTVNKRVKTTHIVDDDVVFLESVTEEIVHDCIARTIDRTGNAALKKDVCMVCARMLFMESLCEMSVSDIPNKRHLIPIVPHSAHVLTGIWLLHDDATAKPSTYVCDECYRDLKKNRRPALALSNNMWIGRVPFELSVLTLPERLLVAMYFPAAYIVKLFPKIPGARSWDRRTINSGMKGNVSTYRLNTADICDIIQGGMMPPSSTVLSATIGVTFVGARNIPLKLLPDFLRVRRRRVRDALRWLKANNPLYGAIIISDSQLELLPVNGVPAEISNNVKYSLDTTYLDREQNGYVPLDAEEEADRARVAAENESSRLHNESQFEEDSRFTGVDDVDINDVPSMHTVGLPAGTIPVLEAEDVHEDYEPAAFPLQSLGVVDGGGDNVTDKDVLAHALANSADSVARPDFAIRRGSAFVNEYARRDEITGERTDGGPANPNHMLGAFPFLFPYGKGGLEVDREIKVPYETHIRWALQYADGRFRNDLYFIFQAFGVVQKRQVCRAASLQVTRSAFIHHQAAFLQLKPQDLLRASGEESRGVRFSNPVVQSLRSNLTAVRARVQGTDESRQAIRGQIWAMNLRFNPPNIWATINLSDTNDPIAQVLAGVDIDLDKFVETAGPDGTQRSITVAADPYAAAEFFHTSINVMLQELFGICVRKGGHITRKKGILGSVNGYIGTVEAQGRGTLHLHILMWLRGAPSSPEMEELLRTDAFRERVKTFICKNIKADIGGSDAIAIKAMKKTGSVAYSRPPDPRVPGYEASRRETEIRVARAVQVHECSLSTCLRTKKGRLVCKRRAPFPLASDDWILPNGDWGPRRICGKVNAWNPTLLQVTRSNHDMKLVTHGEETKDIGFYITLYIAKKQTQASNASALLAKSMAYHRQQDKKAQECKDLNKRMLQQCANTLSRQHEFSGPEVISYLMGWGDRFVSHLYVVIYWDSVASAVRRAFPGLEKKRFITAVADQLGEEPPESPPENDAETIRITLVDGNLVMRDQVKEYTDRGLALAGHNFYQYFRDTYDGPSATKGKVRNESPADCAEGQDSGQGVDEEEDEDPTVVPAEFSEDVAGKKRAGRPRSTRVPYHKDSKRKGCRVIRSGNHETIPRFVGSWFPRHDKGQEEYYGACMLALLKPWRTFNDLKDETQTFATAFQEFLGGADDEIKGIISNINYFHECTDSSKRRREEGNHGGGAVVHLTEAELHEADVEDANAVERELTEEDVDLARTNAYPLREFLYGQGAMAVAEEMGIFSEEPHHICAAPEREQATYDDLKTYQDWGAKVAAMTRDRTLVADNRPKILRSEEAAVVRAPVIEEFRAGVVELTRISPVRKRPAEQQKMLDMLNTEQRRAHDIIEGHLLDTLAGRNPDQLLMVVRGEGGTGKTVLLNAISDTFDFHNSAQWLGKTATTGVAASLIGGQTIHSWAGIPINAKDQTDWISKGSKATVTKRKKNVLPTRYLEIDEYSMLTKQLLCQLSKVVGHVKAANDEGSPVHAFGGMNVILFGDMHQFPPVNATNGALYCPENKRLDAELGAQIYAQFTTVVTLTEQIRVTDQRWKQLLGRLRTGDCTSDDMVVLNSLLLNDPSCDVPNFEADPWRDAILVTPQHGARIQWNAAATRKHCRTSGHTLYICPSEDTTGVQEEGLSMEERVVVAGMKLKHTAKLSPVVELAVGMRAMVLMNISTEGDLANGTRGVVEDIKIDPRERYPLSVDDEGAVHLQYPPAMVLFRPDHCSFEAFEGLPAGVLPIIPSRGTFSIKKGNGTTATIIRRQFALTAGYAFTDYKSQGQTLGHVLVDLARPPQSKLTPFNAYVALSRSSGRNTIRLLRQFDTELFTTHPSEALAKEDARMDILTRTTQTGLSN